MCAFFLFLFFFLKDVDFPQVAVLVHCALMQKKRGVLFEINDLKRKHCCIFMFQCLVLWLWEFKCFMMRLYTWIHTQAYSFNSLRLILCRYSNFWNSAVDHTRTWKHNLCILFCWSVSTFTCCIIALLNKSLLVSDSDSCRGFKPAISRTRIKELHRCSRWFSLATCIEEKSFRSGIVKMPSF